jgi:integrase
MLSCAVEDGLIDRNPALGLRIRKGHPSPIQTRTKDELLALACSAPLWYRALVLFLGITGARIGEVAALRLCNVHLEERWVRIEENLVSVGGRRYPGTTKTDRARTIRIPQFLADALKAHIQAYRRGAGPKERAFVNKMGGELDASSVRRALKRAARRCGQPPLSTHSLRNTAAHLALEAGAELRDIQDMLGHSNLTTTFLYLQRVRQDPMASRLADRLDTFLLGR